MKIVTAAEMREIDRVTTDRYGVPSLTLMENAGSAVAEFCLEEYPKAQRVGVICGKGNNGGDGFVAARKLHEAGKTVSVLLLAETSDVKSDVKGDAAEMLRRLPVPPVIARNEEELKADAARKVFESELLVDAILGTGFKPPVDGLYAAAIGAMNASAAAVVAVDVPSGTNADAMKAADAGEPRARADALITFTAPRPAHVFADLLAGPMAVAQIGSPEEAIASTLDLHTGVAGDFKTFLKPRALESNKGDFGHVLVVGGSRGKAGAAAMAGMAALRSGAGLCTVSTPVGIQNVVSGFAPELMTEGLTETETGSISLRALDQRRMETILRGKTVVAVGPGISRHQESAELVRTLVRTRQAPMVLDADGLNAFEGVTQRLDGNAPLIVTPHPGEMARLTGRSTAEVQQDRIGVARKFAHDHECIVVLKGHRTLVAEPGGAVWVNTTGNPGMATGGTGDILTGMIAGILAQAPSDLVRAVVFAVYLHGLAGDLARDRMGEQSMIATDLLKYLPAAFHEVGRGTHSQSTVIQCGVGAWRTKRS